MAAVCVCFFLLFSFTCKCYYHVFYLINQPFCLLSVHAGVIIVCPVHIGLIGLKRYDCAVMFVCAICDVSEWRHLDD